MHQGQPALQAQPQQRGSACCLGTSLHQTRLQPGHWPSQQEVQLQLVCNRTPARVHQLSWQSSLLHRTSSTVLLQSSWCKQQHLQPQLSLCRQAAGTRSAALQLWSQCGLPSQVKLALDLLL